MTLLLAIVGIVLFWRMSRRMKRLEDTVTGLTETIRASGWTHGAESPRVAPIPPAAAETVAAATEAAAPPPPASTLETPAPTFPVLEPELELPPVLAAPQPSFSGAALNTSSAESLETRIGSRWLLYVGVLAIIVGAAYFEKLAIDNEWLTETMRVVQGTIVGLLMVAGAHFIIRRGYDTYGQILSGCGLAVMYVAAYAAFNFYHLIAYGPALVWMAGLTLAAAVLGDRYRSQGLAIVAVGGSFVTPFLLPSASVSEVPLFTYDALLVAGAVFLVGRRDWPMLGVVAYLATLLTLDVWLVSAYRPSRYLTTELFLTLFAALFLGMIWRLRSSVHPLAGLGRLILWSVVPFYYFASLAILAPHDNAFLIYLLALSAIGVALSRQTAPRLRPLFWCAATLPLTVWTVANQGHVALVAGMSAWAGIFTLHLAGLLDAVRAHERQAKWPELFVLHANGLVSFGGAFLLLGAAHPAWSAPTATGLAALHAAIAVWLTGPRRDLALHFAAAAFSLLSLAIAIQFDGAWAITGWSAEAAAITWLGLREQRPWMRIAGLALLAFSITNLFALLFSDPTVGEFLLVNPRALTGLFVVGLLLALAWLHHQQSDERRRALDTGIALVAATLMVLAVAVSEIVAFWALRAAAPFEPGAQTVIASAIIGGVIVWIGVVRRQEWVRTIGLVVVGQALLSLLSIQLMAAPAAYAPVMNGRVLAGTVAVAVCYVLMQLYRAHAGAIAAPAVYIAALSLAASVFTLSLVSSEIEALWPRQIGASTTSGNLTRELTLTLSWALYATGAIIVGLRRDYAPIRYFAIALFGITIVKVFAVDLSYLRQIYRVLSILGLGVLLLITSYLYQRARRNHS